MIDFPQLLTWMNDNKIQFVNQNFNNIVQDYTFLYILNKNDFDQNEKIYQNFLATKILVIDQFEVHEKDMQNVYIVVVFERSVIITNSHSLLLLKDLFAKNDNLLIYFLRNSKNVFDQNIQISYNELKQNPNIADEIKTFQTHIKINKKMGINESIRKTWIKLLPCISCYLIEQSYVKLNKNRINDYFNNHEEIAIENMKENDDYIYLRDIGIGSLFCVKLIYHIKKRKLLALKRNSFNDFEHPKLKTREFDNYSNLYHPFMPKFYGKTKNNQDVIIEYINGQTLSKIGDIHLNDDEKISIIFQLMLIIQFLHLNHYIYRDLKPNNVMIDENKNVVLIDYDRMIKIDDDFADENHTNILSSIYTAPEVNTGNFSYECDIYSLGMMIYYIINEQIPDQKKNIELPIYCKHKQLLKLFFRCTNSNMKNRISISKLMHRIYQNYPNIINIDFLEKLIELNTSIKIKQNSPYLQNTIGCFYLYEMYHMYDINKAISMFQKAADQDYPEALFNLGKIFYVGDHVQRDIQKGISYIQKASNQNYIEALFYLGNYYTNSDYVICDYNKAVDYYKRAAEKNHLKSIIQLALIYENDLLNIYNIHEAIYYYKLACDQNDQLAQNNLSSIYYKGKDVPCDINMCIEYLQLAAKQNDTSALLHLFDIYLDNKNDVSNAMKFLTLAVKQKNAHAQYLLGNIYYIGKYVPPDINKAIIYLQLSANSNYLDAYCDLGFIYISGIKVPKDLRKGINYLVHAAQQNHPESQFLLGFVYLFGDYFSFNPNQQVILIDDDYENRSLTKFIFNKCLSTDQNPFFNINKALYYFSLSANQGNSFAIFYLFLIYGAGFHTKIDIKKSNYYFSLIENDRNPEMQFQIGLFYDLGLILRKNSKKAFFYYKLSANQGYALAQYYLSLYYLYGIYIEQNISKAIYYITQSSEKGIFQAHFILGSLYHEGKLIKKDISKATSYYKKGSNSDDQFAKNNLAIIYKENGILANAIEYLEEAIHLSGDVCAFYNLANIYMHNENITNLFDKLIVLFKNIQNLSFQPAKDIISIVLLKKFKFNVNNIKSIYKIEFKQLEKTIMNMINDPRIFNEKYEYYMNIEYLYNYKKEIVESSIFLNDKSAQIENPQMKEITDVFYEGFGADSIKI